MVFWWLRKCFLYRWFLMWANKILKALAINVWRLYLKCSAPTKYILYCWKESKLCDATKLERNVSQNSDLTLQSNYIVAMYQVVHFWIAGWYSELIYWASDCLIANGGAQPSKRGEYGWVVLGCWGMAHFRLSWTVFATHIHIQREAIACNPLNSFANECLFLVFLLKGSMIF